MYDDIYNDEVFLFEERVDDCFFTLGFRLFILNGKIE